MKRLGYTRYVAQGGDWGAIVVEMMGIQAGPELLAVHTNLPLTRSGGHRQSCIRQRTTSTRTIS